VKDGTAISLAHTLDKEVFPDNPRPLGQQMTLDNAGHAMDLYSIWYHGSTITHIDALCHYSFEGKIFNGFDRAKIAQGPGCPDNGVENQKAGIMTRGIIVDLPRMKNVPYLEPGTPVYPSDLEAWEKYAGLKISAGDALFLRTGRWAQRAQKGPWNVAREAAGWHASVMPWLKQRDVALLGNDAVNDVQPSGVEGNARPIHQLAIVAMGLPLIDVMDLEAAAEYAARIRRWEFLLTAAPGAGARRHRVSTESDRDILNCNCSIEVCNLHSAFCILHFTSPSVCPWLPSRPRSRLVAGCRSRSCRSVLRYNHGARVPA
jgi:kynurenine formamidase